MSRHGRRRTRGQDDQWGPGDFLPPDADDPSPPADYGQAHGGWGRNPTATADTGDFPVTDSSLPPVSYPRNPGQRGEDFDWGPGPRGPGARGSAARGTDPAGRDRAGGPPQPGPMAPDRWAPQSWESPSWERASWDSETAQPPGGLNPPGAGPDWAEPGDPPGYQRGPAPGYEDLQGGELPPLPPGPMPGTGHPSGPLPPLPESSYLWDEPPPGPLPPAAPRSRPPGRDQDRSRRWSRRGSPPAGAGPVPDGYLDLPAGYPGEGPGYPDDPAAYLPDWEEPADYPGPRDWDRRGHPAGPDVGQGHPGYEGYVDDPRDLDMAPDQGQEPQNYAPSGSWYPDEDEPHAWAEDSYDDDGGGLLPGLDQRQGSGRGNGGGPAGPSRKRRRGGRTVLLVLLTVFILFVAAAGGVGYHYYREYINPPDFSGAGTGDVTVQILPGQTASTIGATLASKGVVASARAFSNAAKASPQGNALEPGYYRVHRHMKASLALALLLKPSSRLQTKVTIPEGFRVAQIIALLGKETGDLNGYQQAIAHPAGLGLPAFAHGKPEGYLFPATYQIPPHTTPAAVLSMMVSQFKQNAQAIGLPAAAARAQETQAGVITVASLIEAEGRPQDFAKIAEVIYNRLNTNMKLQLDTTVLYAMSLAHKSGFSTTFASPYNTYAHTNLPPGPIDNPGNTAINAALHPAHGNLLYFLTINSSSGKTLFFSTAAAFNSAVQKYGSSGTGTGSRTGSG